MVLITGANENQGAYILLELLKHGEKVRALLPAGANTDETKKIFKFYADAPDELFSKIEWVKGSITDYESVLKAMEGIKHVVHASALISHIESLENLMAYNKMGTENIVNVALRLKIKKFYYLSSIQALSTIKDKSGSIEKYIDEQTSYEDNVPPTPYAYCRYKTEEVVKKAQSKGLNAVIINGAWPLGAGNWERGFPSIFTLVWKGLRFYPKGIIGFVDVRDIAKAMLMLMKSDIKNEQFIVSAENLSFKKIYELIADGLGKKRPTFYLPSSLIEIAWRLDAIRSAVLKTKPYITKGKSSLFTGKKYYSNQKIKNTLNFEFIPIRESIKHTCELFLREIQNITLSEDH